MFVRAFFLQSLWNFERLQNIGLLYVMLPFFKKLYPDKNVRKEVLLRHLGFFNTHPYMANIVFAVVANGEKKYCDDNTCMRVNDLVLVKNTLAGPIAAIGDSFFWGTWRPFCAFIAILWAVLSFEIFDNTWACFTPIIFIVLYNFMHLSVRYWLLMISFKMDREMAKFIAHFELNFLADVVRILGVLIIVAALTCYFIFFGFVKNENFFILSDVTVPIISVFSVVLILSMFLSRFVRSATFLFYTFFLISFVMAYLRVTI
jgi:PTS system mannose-specific IID component